MAAKVRHVVVLELDIDPDEPVDPVAEWDWPLLLEMQPDDVRVATVIVPRIASAEADA